MSDGSLTCSSSSNNSSKSLSSDKEKQKNRYFTVDLEDIELGKVIGNGAFAQIHIGTYRNQCVAVKVQPDDDPTNEEHLPKQVLAEVMAYEQLGSHPSIVDYLGASYDDEKKTISMVVEYLDGGDVESFLEQGKGTWRERVQIALDIARGIQHLHSKGLLHRDIKCSNMLLTKDKRAKLCDFGFVGENLQKRLERYRGEQDAHGQRKENEMGTQEQYSELAEQDGHENHEDEQCSEPTYIRRLTLCGTDSYMAPEMYFDEDYDEQADVFSFGISLMEIITGRRVNQADFLMRLPQSLFQISIEEFRAAITATCTASATICPVSFSLLAESCASFEPHDRPNINEVVEWLEGLLEDIEHDNYANEMMVGTSTIVESSALEYNRSSCSAAYQNNATSHNENEPYYMGTLLKRNRHGFKRWTHRWVVLQGSQLKYYGLESKKVAKAKAKAKAKRIENEKGRDPNCASGALSYDHYDTLSLYGCGISKKSNTKFVIFGPKNSCKKIEFATSCPAHTDQWVKEIQAGIVFANKKVDQVEELGFQ